MARTDRRFTGSPAVPSAELRARLNAGEEPGPGSDADPFHEAARRFPVRWTRYYLDLTRPGDDDPIRRIAYPSAEELEPGALDLDDPVGERALTPVPYVVRKHRDRAVFLVTSRCHVYCRFCFRRSFPDGQHADPGAGDLENALNYLVAEPELREVILSGGDPLALPDAELGRIIERLSRSAHLQSLRIHTRAPVHDPDRVSPELVRVLASGLPAWVVLHFNHPNEVTERTADVARLFLEQGLPVLNQSVLLSGVNDDAAVLEELCRKLMRCRIKPYYLHHPDRVPGAGAFYVSIERGLDLYRELRQRLGGGPALPSYVIDLPDGTGKVPVESLGRSDYADPGPNE